MVEHVKVDALWSRYMSEPRHIVNRVSFEERSIVLAETLGPSASAGWTTFLSLKRNEDAEINLSKFRNLHPNARYLELDTTKPIQTASAIVAAISNASERSGLDDAIIDISSFRREELLILFAVLRQLAIPRSTRCELVYVAAKRMANTLSNDVVGHRSVIGYAGEMWPSKPTRLVVLMGFEIHRARSIIENYEPGEIVLGMGLQSESINKKLHEMNLAFFNELRRQSANVISKFEFSVRDPLLVSRKLEEVLADSSESNIVIAPLNTKLSTLGVGLYAQNHPHVQVCYAPVREYNEKEYSIPSDHAYILQLKDLL